MMMRRLLLTLVLALPQQTGAEGAPQLRHLMRLPSAAPAAPASAVATGQLPPAPSTAPPPASGVLILPDGRRIHWPRPVAEPAP
jgi:hypothetical protein